MRIPLKIQGEWGSLAKTDDRERNLESLRVIRAWLDDVEKALEGGRLSSKDPKIYGHATSGVKGLTHPDFDGVDMAKLRYWLKWWDDPSRSRHGREEAGRDPKVEAAKVRREIEARER